MCEKFPGEITPQCEANTSREGGGRNRVQAQLIPQRVLELAITAELVRLTSRGLSLYTISPLHTNLEVVSFQRCEHAFHQWQAWVKLQPALRLLLLTILRLHHLPPPLFLQSGTPLAWTLDASPCMPAVVPYCKVKNVLFIFCVYYVLFAQSWTRLQQLSTAQTSLGLYCYFCLNFSVLILSLDVCYGNWWLSFLLSPVSVSLALFFNTYFPWCLPDTVMF